MVITCRLEKRYPESAATVGMLNMYSDELYNPQHLFSSSQQIRSVPFHTLLQPNKPHAVCLLQKLLRLLHRLKSTQIHSIIRKILPLPLRGKLPQHLNNTVKVKRRSSSKDPLAPHIRVHQPNNMQSRNVLHVDKVLGRVPLQRLVVPVPEPLDEARCRRVALVGGADQRTDVAVRQDWETLAGETDPSSTFVPALTVNGGLFSSTHSKTARSAAVLLAA